MFKFLSLFAIFLTLSAQVASASVKTYKFGLNDVSILLPLPQISEFDLLLNPEIQNKLGPLLGQTPYRFLPILTPLIDHDTNYKYNLKVVAIRFDPCFQEGFTPIACQRHIRLVWQPLHIRNNNQVSTVDAAIHTFYKLSEAEWSQLLNDVAQLAVTDKTAPLQVHPVMAREGYTGAYWQQLKSVILKYAGEKTIIRATAMTVRMDRVWGFQGVDFVNGSWTQIQIPTLKSPNSPIAKVVNVAIFFEPESLLNLREYRGGITLLESNNKQWFRLLSDSAKYAETQSESDIREALTTAYKIENPKFHNPGTVDCASCHIAQTIRFWGNSHRPDMMFSEGYKNSEFNLTNTSNNPWMTNKFRAFGYFDRDVSISQRVINETAEVVKSLGFVQ